MNLTKQERDLIKGKRIIEATRPLIISLTQVDIDHAVPGSTNHCAFGKAGKATYPDSIFWVKEWSTWKITETCAIRYFTPKGVREALPYFDRFKIWNLPPGDYKFLAICPSQTLEAQKIRARKRLAKADPNKTRRYPQSLRVNSSRHLPTRVFTT